MVRVGMGSAWVAPLVGLLGCTATPTALVASVKTDLIAGVEFTSVTVEVFDREPSASDEAPRALRADVPARGAVTWLDAERVAELHSVPVGPAWVRVRLLDGPGALVAERLITTEVRGVHAVTALFSRDCLDVVCPGPGDPEHASACYGGRCVDPACTPETPERCGELACARDADCEAPAAPCARAGCVDGACFAVTVMGVCEEDAWCDPDRGCRPLSLPPPDDAGAPRHDAGPPDAGTPDAGTPDAGPGCGFATCRADGSACGTCGDGSDGVLDITADRTLAAGRYDVESLRIASGVTVTVTGAQPLRILSRGLVDIAGTLELSGQAGASSTCAAGAPTAGGAGGGGAGSEGGDGGYNGARVGIPGAGPGGGQPSELLGGAGGGGGGGGNASMGGMGGDGVCSTRCGQPDQVGGSGGAAYTAIDDTVLLGGSGGAGGMYGSADQAHGGAGGGGAGAVLIVAPEIRVGGAILGRGGAGGGGGGVDGRSCDGGGGGGGSGGTIWLRASRIGIMGTVDARGGAGGPTGVGGSAAMPGAGGQGAPGAIRIDALELTGTTTPPAATGAPLCDGSPC